MFHFLFVHTCMSIFFFFNDTATTEIYTLSLHDALPIYDALDPMLAHFTLGTARQNQGILDGDADLIIEAIRHPQLQLLARQLAAVHALVEGVEVVVAALQHGAQPADQLVHRGRGQLHAHSSNSIASSPTTMPAASTRARSAELRHRIGLVLLT